MLKNRMEAKKELIRATVLKEYPKYEGIDYMK
jgi:hypothetical protein